jgi:hypothetical protein
MSKPIEMITVPAENGPQPVEEWNARISVMTTDAQDANVKCDQRVTKCGKAKSTVRGRENNEADQAGKNLQPPGKSIVRLPT